MEIKYNDWRRDGVVVDSKSQRPAVVTVAAAAAASQYFSRTISNRVPNGRQPTLRSWRAVIPELRLRGHALWIRSPRSRPRDFLFALHSTRRQAAYVTVHVGAVTMMDNATTSSFPRRSVAVIWCKCTRYIALHEKVIRCSHYTKL